MFANGKVLIVTLSFVTRVTLRWTKNKQSIQMYTLLLSKKQTD